MTLHFAKFLLAVILAGSASIAEAQWCGPGNCPSGRDMLQRQLVTGPETRGSSIVLNGDSFFGKHYITANGNSSDITTTGSVIFNIDSSKPTPWGYTFTASDGGWISDSADVDLRAGHRVILSSGVRVKQGAYLHAYILPKYTSRVFTDDFNDDTSDSHYFNSSSTCQWLKETSFNAGVTEANFPSQANEIGGELVLEMDATTSSFTAHNCDGSSSPGFHIKSARIDTKVPIPTTYGACGKYEVRAKIPTECKMFPAIWLGDNAYRNCLSNNGAEEVDIMERWDAGCVGNWFLHQNTVPQPPPGRFGEGQSYFGNSAVDYGADYHVYAVEWEPNCMRFLLDDTVVFRVPENNRTDRTGFHNAMVGMSPAREVMELNFATGITPTSDPTVFSNLVANPQFMKVDWVRVWDDPMHGVGYTLKAASGPTPRKPNELLGVDPTFSPEVRISPNPSYDGLFTVRVSGIGEVFWGGNLQVDLYDVLGKLVTTSSLPQILLETSTLKIEAAPTIPDGNYICVATVTKAGHIARSSRRVTLSR